MSAAWPAARTTWVTPEPARAPRCPVDSEPLSRPRSSSQAKRQAAEDNYRLRYGVPPVARYLAWLAEHTD
jgi:hypothetical protein